MSDKSAKEAVSGVEDDIGPQNCKRFDLSGDVDRNDKFAVGSKDN